MSFRESESYLLSLGNEVSAMKLGLENIRELLAALGDPQNNYLKVQIAGTNGKGSVCAFLDAICFSAGIKTGLYTSPHLISITERIRINGRDISEENFARHAARVRETAEKLLANGELEYRPTFFEQVTAIALIAFAEAKVEVAILETGLGGRLDATTAANAEIAAITQIDFDHQEYLGESLAEIAAEKAAIIRKDSKVVIADQKPEVMAILTSVSANFGISPGLAREVAADTVRRATGRERVSESICFHTPKAAYESTHLGLLGRHQIENAKVAILLAELLQNHFSITRENIIDGLQSARHPGRLEFKDNFLFDGAHNRAGASALGEFIDQNIEQPIVIIFAAMKGKDIDEIASILFSKADVLILTKPKNSRAMSPEEIGKYVPSEINVILTGSVAEAVTKAREIAGRCKLILITGSLYLVGEAKKILNN